jgi:hypothetical protein
MSIDTMIDNVIKRYGFYDEQTYVFCCLVCDYDKRMLTYDSIKAQYDYIMKWGDYYETAFKKQSSNL